MIPTETLEKVSAELIGTADAQSTIAKRNGVSDATVSRIAEQINAPKRNRGRCQGATDTTFTYLNHFKAGHGVSETARLVGVSRQAASAARIRLIDRGLLTVG